MSLLFKGTGSEGLLTPGWLRKVSVRYLQIIPEGDGQHLPSSSQVGLLAFTWWYCFKPSGEGKRRIHLAP